MIFEEKYFLVKNRFMSCLLILIKQNYAMIESNVKEDNVEILTKFHNVEKRKKRFKLINNNPFEKTYAEGTQIATAQSIQKSEIDILKHNKFNNAFRAKINQEEINCACVIKAQKSIPIIIFANVYGITGLNYQFTSGMKPLSYWKRYHRTVQDDNIFFLSEKLNENYEFNTEKLLWHPHSALKLN